MTLSHKNIEQGWLSRATTTIRPPTPRMQVSFLSLLQTVRHPLCTAGVIKSQLVDIQQTKFFNKASLHKPKVSTGICSDFSRYRTYSLKHVSILNLHVWLQVMKNMNCPHPYPCYVQQWSKGHMRNNSWFTASSWLRHVQKRFFTCYNAGIPTG